MSIYHSSKPSAATKLMPGGKLECICRDVHQSSRLFVYIMYGQHTFGSSFARRFEAVIIVRWPRVGFYCRCGSSDEEVAGS
jgi:hypothetical protein